MTKYAEVLDLIMQIRQEAKKILDAGYSPVIAPKKGE